MNENEYSCQVCDRIIKAGSDDDQDSICIRIDQADGSQREFYICGRCWAGRDTIFVRQDGRVQLATK